MRSRRRRAPDLNRLRLKAAWVLAIPFLVLSRPTFELILIGGAMAAMGLLLRAWAAGTIHKETDLTTSGPYAFTRNPLYLGSFLIGIGVTVAGGHWLWTALFVGFFTAVYARTMAAEAGRLTDLFGDRYRSYVRAVPAFLPRITPHRPPASARSPGFRFSQYRRNREWEALLGGVAAFAFLALKAFGA